MDRTSILGDTIDYMKELLEKIRNLQLEIEADSNIMGIFNSVKPNEVLVRNSPKVRSLHALLSQTLKTSSNLNLLDSERGNSILCVAFAV